MSINTYKDMDKWFEAKRRGRKKYYAATSNAINNRKLYTDEENAKILAHEISDRELSKEIGRSMKAIQHQRARLKQKEKSDNNDNE